MPEPTQKDIETEDLRIKATPEQAAKAVLRPPPRPRRPVKRT